LRVGDLPVGKYEIVLRLRSGVITRANGKVAVCKDGNKYFITRSSLKCSLAPNTVVIRSKRR